MVGFTKFGYDDDDETMKMTMTTMNKLKLYI